MASTHMQTMPNFARDGRQFHLGKYGCDVPRLWQRVERVKELVVVRCGPAQRTKVFVVHVLGEHIRFADCQATKASSEIRQNLMATKME